MITSETLLKFIRATRVAAWIQLFFAIASTVMLSLITAQEKSPDTKWLINVGFVLGVFFVLPTIMLLLASKLEQGRAWAGYAICIVVAMLFLVVLIGMVSVGCMLPIVSLPLLYLVATSFNAYGEIRHLQRTQRREREYKIRGFPVVMGPTPQTKPPAPQQSLAQTKPPPPSSVRRR